MTIVGLFTELTSVGGIQLISQHACAVLSEFSRSQGYLARFLTVGEEPGERSFTVAGETFKIRGCNRNKLAFVKTALSFCREGPLFVYVAHVNLAPVAWSMKKCCARVQYGVALHGSADWSDLPFYKRHALRQADLVMPVSTTLAHKAKDLHGVRSERIFVIPPALDPEWFSSIRATKLEHEWGVRPKRKLLTVGRLEDSSKDKGINIDGVIRALPDILEAVPDTSYVVVGDGRHRKALEELARTLGVEDKVEFVGVKKGSELSWYFEDADIYVMPSYREGFGIVFLEAMAHRKPVIGGIPGGATDVIVDGHTGFLVPPDDTAELVRKVTSLLRDPLLCAHMGKNGYERLMNNYTFESFRHRFMSILDNHSNLP